MKGILWIFFLTGTSDTTFVDKIEYETWDACMVAAFKMNADQSNQTTAGACIPKVDTAKFKKT